MKHAREDYNRIQDPAGLIPEDEPVFLLRAQDQLACEAVRYYAELCAKNQAPEVAAKALAHAELMAKWPKKKIPDIKTVPDETPRKDFKYMVFEDNYFEGGVERLHQYGCDTVKQALACMLTDKSTTGIGIRDPNDTLNGGWRELLEEEISKFRSIEEHAELRIQVFDFEYKFVTTTEDGFAVYKKNRFNDRCHVYLNKTIYLTADVSDKLMETLVANFIGLTNNRTTWNSLISKVWDVLDQGFLNRTVALTELGVKNREDNVALMVVNKSPYIYFQEPARAYGDEAWFHTLKTSGLI